MATISSSSTTREPEVGQTDLKQCKVSLYKKADPKAAAIARDIHAIKDRPDVLYKNLSLRVRIKLWKVFPL